MKSLFLLILLTQNGAGDINAAFANTETLEACQQKAALIEGLFVTAKIPIIENRCIKSDLRFSKFSHDNAASTRAERSFYVIRFDETVELEKMDGWRSCMTKQHESAEQGRVYCSSTAQSALP